MNRGEVWTIEGPAGRRWRVLVVSGDAHNDRPGAFPFVIPLVHRPPGELPPYVAALCDPDPVGGVALAADLGQIDPHHRIERVGMITGASMSRIAEALRDLFEL